MAANLSSGFCTEGTEGKASTPWPKPKRRNLWQINLQRNLINVGVYAAQGMETFFHMNSGAERGETGN